MRRKSLIVASFFILAIALLVAAGPMELSLNSVAAHVAGNNEPSTPPDAIQTPQAEVLPMYPGALPIAVEPRYQVANATVTAFEVYGEPSDVLDFYRSELIKSGWRVRSDVPMRQLGMAWSDRSGNSPWNLDIDLSISYQVDSAQHKTKTSAMIYLRRVPNPEKVPAYPGATPIPVIPEPTRMEGYPEVIHNAYVTTATLAEVEAFYTRVLPEYGWIRQEPKDADITVGLPYAFRLGSVANIRTAYLAVQAKLLDDGSVQIDVLSSGNTDTP